MLLSSTKSTLFKLLAPVYSRVNHVIAGVEFTVKCLDFNLMLNSCREVYSKSSSTLPFLAVPFLLPVFRSVKWW